jgi:hypothetical protein
LGGGEVDDSPEIVEEITKSLTDSEPIQKALDVSEYLEAQHGALLESLETVAKSIDASDQRAHEFNLVFAKAFHQVGELVKGMSERLGVIESQPAHAPKSKGIPAQQVALEKGFVGEASPDTQMSKSEILDTFESMMQKSDGGQVKCGEDILHATAKYEGSNQISKAMYDEIVEFRKGQAH